MGDVLGQPVNRTRFCLGMDARIGDIEPPRVYRRVEHSKVSLMRKKPHTPAYPAELREGGVRLFRENRSQYPSDNAAYHAIAPKLGCSPDSLRV